ncbi:Lsr2 family protein [Streptomyces sp. NPDC126514]|uniref:histone-like nucleoid-structuring protein Lsr2 n=1 Tax=Streptomyces sp. NPDC126514 TaxID=3155210 RepID=UPI00331E2C9B
MAQRTVVIYTDDITGEQGEDVALHTFSLDGIAYEIDLGTESHQKLLDALGPFLKSGRKVKGNTRRRTGQRASGAEGGLDAGKVREWARSQGLTVNERGRVPREVIEKYQAAHN